MNKIHCSVPILTLNCKKQLERLLPVVTPIFEDVFIMDGGSTDGTREYAASMGVRIEKQFDTDAPNQRITDFRAMRFRLWDACHCDWMFCLDADMEPTPEAIELVRKVVAENDTKTIHELHRYSELPDGRVVKCALYYPLVTTHLFARSSGLTLGDRAVHERPVIPPDARVIRHPESIIDPQPSAKEWRERQWRYLPLEAKSIQDTSWTYLFRWIIWYNIRSFLGQLLRAIRCSLTGLFTDQVSLPWSYNWIFLEYRLHSMVVNVKAWNQKRKERRSTSGA